MYTNKMSTYLKIYALNVTKKCFPTGINTHCVRNVLHSYNVGNELIP